MSSNKKYPEAWIKVITGDFENPTIPNEAAENMLDTLAELGALKTPPKPREFWLCVMAECRDFFIDNGFADVANCKNRHKCIRVREVLDDDV